GDVAPKNVLTIGTFPHHAHGDEIPAAVALCVKKVPGIKHAIDLFFLFPLFSRFVVGITIRFPLIMSPKGRYNTVL
ncbi:MAG: hypothetical protein AAF492_12495, partial [Verrucomicrobiota bacterium]